MVVIAISPSASRCRVAASWLRAVSGTPFGSRPLFAARSAGPLMYLAARRSNVSGNRISAGLSACLGYRRSGPLPRAEERGRRPLGLCFLRRQSLDDLVKFRLDPVELGLLRLAAPVLDHPRQLGLPEGDRLRVFEFEPQLPGAPVEAVAREPV